MRLLSSLSPAFSTAYVCVCVAAFPGGEEPVFRAGDRVRRGHLLRLQGPSHFAPTALCICCAVASCCVWIWPQPPSLTLPVPVRVRCLRCRGAFLWWQENVTIQQIKTFTEMDSHEEKLQKIIMEVLLFPSPACFCCSSWPCFDLISIASFSAPIGPTCTHTATHTHAHTFRRAK